MRWLGPPCKTRRVAVLTAHDLITVASSTMQQILGMLVEGRVAVQGLLCEAQNQ